MEQERSVLDMLAHAVEQARVNREVVEEELRSTPRWRFRRRTALERRLERRRLREDELVRAVASPDRPE